MQKKQIKYKEQKYIKNKQTLMERFVVLNNTAVKIYIVNIEMNSYSV